MCVTFKYFNIVSHRQLYTDLFLNIVDTVALFVCHKQSYLMKCVKVPKLL